MQLATVYTVTVFAQSSSCGSALLSFDS